MQKVIILTVEPEYESARFLGFETYYSMYDKYIEDFNNHIVIRWGHGSPWVYKNGKEGDFKHVINPVSAIQLNIQKDKAIERLRMAVDTPRLFKDKIPANQLAVYRPTAHTLGNGFTVIKGGKIENGMYATEWIKTNTELRIFFCGDQTMMARRVSENKNRLNAEFPCRSLQGRPRRRRTPGQRRRED